MSLLRTLALIVVLAASAVSAVSSFGAGGPTAAPSSFVYDEGQYHYDLQKRVDETSVRAHVGRIYVYDDAVNPAHTVRSAALPVLAAKGGDDILFGQENVRRTFTTADEGSDFIFAGRRVADVASGLRRGTISSDDVPVRYIVRDGHRIAINNRSLLAFRRAGVAPTRTVDVTGSPVLEARLSGRLAEMGGSPSRTIRVRGAGRRASYLDVLP